MVMVVELVRTLVELDRELKGGEQMPAIMKDGEGHFKFGGEDETNADGFCPNDHNSAPQI